MIRIFEVGPRDGLQNLPFVPSTDDKIHLIQLLRDAGLDHIEIASFVHPKAVPNMADAEEICNAFDDKEGFSVLVPNQRGLDRAKDSGMVWYSLLTLHHESIPLTISPSILHCTSIMASI